MISRQEMQTKAATVLIAASLAASSFAQLPKHPVHTPAAGAKATTPGTLPVVLLSDIHFDPFRDPTKFPRLLAEPVTAWRAILSSPDSPDHTQAYAKLTTACGVRGRDTDWPMFESALKAAVAQSAHPAFLTVSGDLIVHEFDCQFRNLAPKAGAEAQAAFAAKLAAFVASEIRLSFPHTPIFLAAGNNDSGCGDYRESADSPFLRALAQTFAITAEGADKSIGESGSYSVALPKPIEHGRMIVLQDIFQARSYVGCGGKANPAATEAQLTWLQDQLESAKAAHEQVWVMAHIPPGIDVYDTLRKKRDVCGAEKPTLFLNSDKLAEMLERYAAEIRLTIFAHSHMDEMHLLRPAKAEDGGIVAVKQVPSISASNGNYPAFTVGEVDPKTAELRDYRVISSDSLDGTAARWAEEYRFSSTYHRKSYSAAELVPLLAAMRADSQSSQPETNAYENYFMVNGGLKSLAFRLVWPQYACSLENSTAADYKACLCTQPAAK